MPGAENSGSANTSPPVEKAHVEVATNEVDVVLSHVRALPSGQISGGIAFLGHNIVKVDRAKRDRG